MLFNSKLDNNKVSSVLMMENDDHFFFLSLIINLNIKSDPKLLEFVL